MKRLLLTGSAGFVGSHLVEHLLKNTDMDIIGVDSFKHRGDSVRIMDNFASIYNKGIGLDCVIPRYNIFCCDLNAPISDRLANQIGDVDFIINMASESHVDRSITDPVPFVQNNVNVALNVLEFARKQKHLEKFIQISTDEVFGAALEGHNHSEWEIHLPSNPYSASKSAQEQIAISYWRTFNIPLILTNTMNMIGERQDREKFLPMLIIKIEKGEEVIIHGSEDYIGKRHYLHARNHADALLHIIKNVDVIRYHDSMEEIIKPERFNIVGDKELNNLELAQMVADLLGKPLHYKLLDFHAARPGHDRRYSLDGSKLAATGWKAPFSLEESLKKTIQWTLSHPEWLL